MLVREYCADPTDPTVASIGRDIYEALSGKLLTERAKRFAEIFRQQPKLRVRAEKAIISSGVHQRESRSQIGHREAERFKKINQMEEYQRAKGIIPTREPMRQPDPNYFKKIKAVQEAARAADARREAARKKARNPRRPRKPGP